MSATGFASDLERMNTALREMGALIVLEDGETFVDPAVAPAPLLRAYGDLVSYGYANGLL